MTKSAEDWLKEAEQHVTVSDHAKAILCYDEALKINPDYLDALLAKGLTLNRLDKPQQALELIDRVIELDPEHAVAHSRKAMVLKNLRRLPEALEFVNKALELNPQSDLIHTEKAIVLREMDKIEEAIESYHQAIKINEKRVNAHWGLGHLLDQQDKTTEAVECYRAAARHQPCAMFYLLMGKCLQKLDRNQEAVETLIKCIDCYENGKPGIGLNVGNLQYIKEELRDFKELHIIAVKAEQKIQELEAKAQECNMSDSVTQDLIAENAALQADKDRLIQFIILKGNHGGANRNDKNEIELLIKGFKNALQNIEAVLQ